MIKNGTKMAIVGFIIITGALILSLTGCASLKEKAIAGEIKVYGLDAEVPSVDGSGSLARIRLGVVTTRWISAPTGGKASIKTEYNDLNFWSLSGSAKSELSVENIIKPEAIDSKALDAIK